MPGYVPKHVLEREKEPLCQRCFRTIHYKKFKAFDFDADGFWKITREAIEEADMVLVIADIMDFEGSLRRELFDVAASVGKPVMVAVNKIDLVPKTVKIDELEAWVRHRIRELWGSPCRFALVSAKKGYGTKKLERLLAETTSRGKVAVLGATNVGKSSLINRLSKGGLTVSPFAGTTQGTLKLKTKEGITLIDTPGYVPGDRAFDALEPECQLKTVPSGGEISRKTFKLDKGKTLMIGSMVAITALDTKRPILIAFAAREVVLHRTRAERVQEIRGNGTGRWIYPPCSPEFFKKFEMEEVEIEVKPGEDISLWGLGWVAVRRGGRILISKPKFMGWCVRPSLSAPWR